MQDALLMGDKDREEERKYKISILGITELLEIVTHPLSKRRERRDGVFTH